MKEKWIMEGWHGPFKPVSGEPPRTMVNEPRSNPSDTHTPVLFITDDSNLNILVQEYRNSRNGISGLPFTPVECSLSVYRAASKISL